MPKPPPPSSPASPADKPEAESAPLLPRREFFGVAAGAVLSLTTGCADEGSAMADADGSTDDSSGDSTGGPLPDLVEDPGEAIAFEPEALPESVELFPRTPISGEMKPTSFWLAGYVATAEAVTVRVWQPSEVEGEVFLAFEEQVMPDPRGFFKLAVEGLRPGEWYDYGLFAGDAEAGFVARSLLCRVRTALAEGSLEPVRVAIGACIGRGVIPEYVDPADPQPVEPWDTMLQAAEHDYDLFIHLGDQGYMDKVYDAGGSLEQYLAAWGAYHGGGYRVVYPKTGLYCTWDDHEVTNNGSVDPWTADPIERERIANGRQAYYTVMPIAASDPEREPLWRSFRWGDTVEFIVLDCRSERQAPETGVYLSDEQFAFLLDRLENSPCRFKCVVNSVPFSRLNLPDDLPLIDVLVSPEDRWEGYATQRAELQALVDAHDLRNILWLTGDVHMCYLGQVELEPLTPGESMWEICVTSGNTNPLADELPEAQFPWRSQLPHLPLITFDPQADLVRVEFVTRFGDVAYHRELQLS
ncbi:Alkaline phosphatase D precursor [Enhygromyxa salina]|uniref:Alkaline phosphatase D n=1 Tax=Enhygromyxa salina TaxID=215803 RepID=A0A2S9YGW4_9BACT|nr:alkaline phosphatase D family protein [Enhygromyxa salina]PRQ04256.1 Alkaline phosphatase D precursor [Enhygromyxa salina]